MSEGHKKKGIIKMKVKNNMVTLPTNILKILLSENINKCYHEHYSDTYGNSLHSYLIADDIALTIFENADDEIIAVSIC